MNLIHNSPRKVSTSFESQRVNLSAQTLRNAQNSPFLLKAHFARQSHNSPRKVSTFLEHASTDIVNP